MLNPYQKKSLVIKKIEFDKVEKPSIIAVFTHFYPDQNLKNSQKATLALCPIHGENHPSFAMYEDTNSYYCFSCGATGDSFNLIMELENLDFKNAVQFAKDHNLYD